MHLVSGMVNHCKTKNYRAQRASPILLLVALLFSPFSCAWAESVHVSAAASMTDVIKALTADYAAGRPALQIRPNFGASGALAKQIEQGAPADIFISANAVWMDLLNDKQLLATESQRLFALNSLVFIGRQTDVTTLQDLPELQLIAIGNPESVPAGTYARQAMTAAVVYDTLAAGNKLILTQDVRQALIYADRGEVDGAFVFKTDALRASSARVLFPVPTDLHAPIIYPAALTRSGAGNHAAREFFDYLFGETAVAILATHGFAHSP